MNKSWILILLTFCALLGRIHCQQASPDNMEGMEGLDDDDDEDYDDTSERQLGGAVRDAVRNFVTGTVKYITNTRLIPSVVSQAFRRPGSSGATGLASSSGSSAASASSSSLSGAAEGSMSMAASNAIESAASAPSSSSTSGLTGSASSLASLANLNSLLPISQASAQIQQASDFLGNVFRTMRSNWARRNQEQQQELRKRLASITKRLTNSRVVLGTLHRLTGREDRDAPNTPNDLKTSASAVQAALAQHYPQYIPVPYFAPF